jgi:hypothetical protein
MRIMILVGVTALAIALSGCQPEVSKEGDKIAVKQQSKPKSFSSMSEKEKEKVIISNVRQAIKTNSDQQEFRNYDFLLEYHNKLRPCPEKAYKLRAYFNDEITVETSIYLNQPYEFLKSDRLLGELGNYGVQFEIDPQTGAVSSYYGYASFTKWSKGKPGSRESLGMKFQEYQPGKVPNIRAKYGDKKLIIATDDFFQAEMKAKQQANKHKCK